MKHLILFLFLISSNVYAGNDISQNDKLNLAVANLIDDHLQCYVYFSVALSGNETRNDVKLDKKLKYAMNYMLKITLGMAQEINIKQEALIAKIKIFHGGQLQSMDNHYKNFAILISKYSDRCSELINKGGFEKQMNIRMREQGLI